MRLAEMNHCYEGYKCSRPAALPKKIPLMIPQKQRQRYEVKFPLSKNNKKQKQTTKGTFSWKHI